MKETGRVLLSAGKRTSLIAKKILVQAVMNTNLMNNILFDSRIYSIGVTVNYNWDFLICIKICATVVV